MNFFDDIDKKLKASAERWKQIDNSVEELKLLIETEKGNHNTRRLWCVEQALLLLIEELRPMGNISEQAKELQNDITKMLDTLEVKNK